MNNYSYQSDWESYTYPETNEVATENDIISLFGQTDITGDHFRRCGIPLSVRGGKAVMNNETESTIIFGETGSKKTRCAIAPLIALAAGAGESAFITDVKGELSSNPKLQKYLESKGVRTVYLDFRTFRGDGYNILEPAFDLYCKGEKNKAMAMVTRFIEAFSGRYHGSSADPFWEMSAKQYLIPVINLVFDYCSCSPERKKLVNMCTLSSFADKDAALLLKKMLEKDLFEGSGQDNIINTLRTVVNNPEKTLACVMSTTQSLLQEFTLQTSLMNMLSCTTFDIDEMYEKPTHVFLIVPDETSAYDTISGMLIDSFYNRLIEVYSDKYQNRSEAPCRINYICDEFCNMKINDMKSKISASRSRNMRWYLVCQSKNQMDTTYPDSSGTIIGNCKNILFLQSADMDMLSYISSQCGTTGVCGSGSRESLITVDMLRTLRKDRNFKEALYIRDGMKYFASLPDIDTYDFLKGFASKKSYTFRNRCPEEVETLTPKRFYYAHTVCGDYE